MANKSRAWLTIIYPDSETTNPDWYQYLSETGQQAIISPLHDSDYNPEQEEGGEREPKKPHYHVMLLWEGPTTERNAKEQIKRIGGVGCLKCASVRGSARYFCHLDNPDKHQYDKSEMVQIGGIDLDAIMRSESDDLLTLQQMYQYIKDNRILIYSDFVDACYLYHEDWFKVLSLKFRENVYKYIKSFAYKVGTS